VSRAIQELYRFNTLALTFRFLELLKNYIALNNIALYKILKKFDKVFFCHSNYQATGRDQSLPYKKKLKENLFYTASEEIKRLLIKIEDALVALERKPRKQIMEKLRMPVKRSMILSCWFYGALAGLSIHPLLSVAESGSRFAEKYLNGCLFFKFMVDSRCL
jgi:SPX domain protein involved in polyphosphate accumulation